MLCVTGVYLRVCLHFVCMGQKVNQRPLNSHYRYKADATDHSWLSSDLASWSLECAGILCHWAISGVSGAPSFWLCNWHEVYCGPIKTSIFKNQHFFKIGQILCFACYYYSVIHSTKQCHFVSDTTLSCFTRYLIQTSKNYMSAAFSDKI